MDKLIAVLCCVMLAASPLALAQGSNDGKKVGSRKEPTAKQLAHQQKMKDCSRQAKDKRLKGDERKRYMSACLKG